MSKKRRKTKARKKHPPRSRAPKKNYRTERFVPYIMRTEVGIHEAATIDMNINDATVRMVIRRLIAQLRQGEPITSEAKGASTGPELIEWRIRDNWARAFEEYGPISNRDLAGCLRTILDSIDVWSGRPLGQRGYLSYLAGFMQQLGVSVRMLSPDEAMARGPRGTI